MRLLLATCCAAASALSLPPTQHRAVREQAGGLASGTPTRRALLGAALASVSPLAAAAFDTPDVGQFDDPFARAKASGRPNPSGSKQLTAAFYALTSGDVQSLKSMAAAGWDLNTITDTAGKTPLHRAAQLGFGPGVQVLLDAGVDVDPSNAWKETPMHFAVRNGKIGVVKQLVGAGANLSKVTGGGDTPLSLARKYRMEEIATYLSAQ